MYPIRQNPTTTIVASMPMPIFCLPVMCSSMLFEAASLVKPLIIKAWID